MRLAASEGATSSSAEASERRSGKIVIDRRATAFDGRFEHLRERVGQIGWRYDERVSDRHQQVVVARIHDGNLEPVSGRLAQPVGEQRMILAQHAADHQRAVEAAHLRDLHAEPRNPGAPAIRAEIGLAQPEVDVIAADAARELGEQMELFERGVGCRQETDRFAAVRVAYLREALRDRIEGGGPVHFAPPSVLAQHRRRQPIGRVQSLVGEAVLVRQPALVDRFVLEREHPHHPVLLDLDHQVRAEPAMGAHRALARELPGARGVAERLRRKRPDRAQIDHVAGQLRVHGLPDERENLRVLAAPRHAEFHHACDFLPEAHAARAVDAARHVGGDERPQILVRHHALHLLEARRARAITHRQILQLTFAALVADRTVEWMVDEQELHHRLLRLPRIVGVGVNLLPARDGGGAGR